jgi:tRNA(fMet)-specific endonuclease VapC
VVKPRFLLDTNVVSEPLKPAPNAGVLRRLEEHQNELAIAAAVWHELLYGCYRLPRSKKRAMIERYLSLSVLPEIPILAYDEPAAQWHAAERARLAPLGRTVPHIDAEIAAVAKVNGLTLVTANRAHFEPFNGLKVEDWRD